jgi:hypothetical protein
MRDRRRLDDNIALMDATACFVRASNQNVFFEELTEALRHALERRGIATEVAVDHFPPVRDGVAYVFVPHEYVPLTLATAHPTTQQLERSVVVGTEQPGTPWFDDVAALAGRAAATIDINELGVAELERRGVEAQLLRLGYVPEWDFWHGEDVSRPTDVAFLGGFTPRRARLIARCGRVLAEKRAAIHLAEGWRPHTARDASFVSGERKFRQLARTKVLLSVHRDTSPYFEWQRVLDAAVNGCVVLTEHSTGFAPLVPGEHFVSASYGNLPVVLEELLEDEERLQAIRHAAYGLLRERMPLDESIPVLADAVTYAATRNVERANPFPDRTQFPAPKPVTLRPVWKRLIEERTDQVPLGAGIKQLVLGQRRLARALDSLSDSRLAPDAVATFGPYDELEPKVSVILTVYNYGRVVGEAIRSVALSTTRDIELVVVDDASSDGSAAAIDAALRAAPWLAAKLIARGRNGGLPAARNLAIEAARGELVFVLDADNVVYRRGIERLREALEADADAAFAYGIIEAFNVGGSFDLLNWIPWAEDRFQFGNYIDAMTLIRRSALEAVGRFTTEDRLLGWEDFALWCAFADAGYRGVHVPEIVARYRASGSSMIGSTNVDTSDAWAVLIDRYPFLIADAVTE